jgi:hypothetical protein
MYDPDSWAVNNIPPVRPRVATAPKINRFDLRQDGDTDAMLGALKIMPASLRQPPNAALEKWKREQDPVWKECVQDQEQGLKVAIVSAFYGADEKNRVDVTAKLKQEFKSSRFIPIRRYNDAFTDVAKNTVKKLWVSYTINGEPKTQVFAEDETVILKK